MTLAQQNGITQFPYILNDDIGNFIYYEDSTGYWVKKEYDFRGNETYYEDSTGYKTKREYDASGNITYLELSDGYWYKREYDDRGDVIYYENSKGKIVGNRPKKPVNHSKIQLTI